MNLDEAMEIKNTHLNKVISKIVSRTDGSLSEALYTDLKDELIYSKLFFPFPDYEHARDENEYIIAFTTLDEYQKHYDINDLDIFEFEDSILYMNEEEGEGAVINPGSDDLKLPLDILYDMRYDYVEPRYYNRKNTHLPKQVFKLKKTKNTGLNSYLKNEKIDKLELLKEVLLSKNFALYINDGEKPKKGVCNRKGPYYIDNNGFGHIYSSWEEVKKVNIPDAFATVPIPEYYIRFILEQDYNGIRINDKVNLTRRFLMRNMETVAEYSRFKNKMPDYSRYGLEIK